MKCLGDFGHCEREGTVRGLCRQCYSQARPRVKCGLTTWEELEALGLAIPTTRVPKETKDFNSRLDAARQAAKGDVPDRLVVCEANPLVPDPVTGEPILLANVPTQYREHSLRMAASNEWIAKLRELDDAAEDLDMNFNPAAGPPAPVKKDLRTRTLEALAKEQVVLSTPVDVESVKRNLEESGENAERMPQTVPEPVPDPAIVAEVKRRRAEMAAIAAATPEVELHSLLAAAEALQNQVVTSPPEQVTNCGPAVLGGPATPFVMPEDGRPNAPAGVVVPPEVRPAGDGNFDAELAALEASVVNGESGCSELPAASLEK